MTFAYPSYLWAMAGLAIPLAIHLLSRKEGKVIRVGSLRHIEESNTSQFKSIRLNEVVLLLLRMLMVIALVLMMSGAQCSGPAGSKKIAYVEKGIATDSLKDYEVKQLPEGSYWSFAEKLNQSSDQTLVISYSKAVNFKGERIALNDNIKWITAESPAIEVQALAWKAGDSVFVRTARSNSLATIYTTSVGVPDSIKIIEPHVARVSTGDKFEIAALKVLQKVYKLPIEITATDGPTLMDQDEALNSNLVMELFKKLYPELQKPEVSADARVLPEQFSWSAGITSSVHNTINSQGIEKYLLLLFILSLAAERVVAFKKNQ